MRRIAAFALAACLMAAALSTTNVAAKSDSRLRAAHSAFQAGNYTKAISRFSSLISAGTHGKTILAQAFYYRGIAFQRSGKTIEALADYTNALWLEGLAKPVSAQCLIRRGYLRLQLRQNDTAIEDMNTAVRTLAGAESYMARAKVLTASGQPEAAMKDLAAAEKLNPNRKWFLHMVRAEALDALGQRDQARAEAKTAMDINPDAGYAPLSRLYARLGGHGQNGVRQMAGRRPAAGKAGPGLITGSIRKPAPGAANGWTRATSIHRAATATPARTAAPARAPAKRRRAGRKPTLSGSGAYVLQLAASSSLVSAKRAVHRMARQNNPLLAGHDLFVVKGLSRANQQIFRVRLGPFANRTEPTGLCAKLKAAGQDCFVTRR